MKLLLDTCTFLWITEGSKELSAEAAEAFLNEENEAYLSVISLWEIAVKYNLGRIELPGKSTLEPNRFFSQQREKHGINCLQLSEEATLHLFRIPSLHKDPFDRMLVCQALVEGMVLVTPDRLIHQYATQVLW